MYNNVKLKLIDKTMSNIEKIMGSKVIIPSLTII